MTLYHDVEKKSVGMENEQWLPAQEEDGDKVSVRRPFSGNGALCRSKSYSAKGSFTPALESLT